MEQTKGKEIEIKKIINIFKKRFWIILVITAITSVVGYVHTNNTKPIPLYDASARIIIHESSSFMNTLTVFITEHPVLVGVIQELDLNMSPNALRNQISVNTVGSSQIVQINVVNRDHVLAADIANTVTSVFQREAEIMFNYRNIDVLSEATASSNPYPINPPSNRMFYISIIFGIVTSIGFILLLDSLDNKLRSQREIERLLGVPVVGTVSKINNRTLMKNKEKKTNSSVRSEIVGSKN